MSRQDEYLEQMIIEAVKRSDGNIIDVAAIIQAMGLHGYRITADQVTAGYLRLEQKAKELESGNTKTRLAKEIKRDLANCERCQIACPIYVYTIPEGKEGAGEYAWDVSKAIWYTRDPNIKRHVQMVPKSNVREIVAANEHYPEHLDHVDTSIPGIIVPFADEDNFSIHIVIDGNHRAAKCIRDDADFLVVALTKRESEDCILWSPQKPLSRDPRLRF